MSTESTPLDAESDPGDPAPGAGLAAPIAEPGPAPSAPEGAAVSWDALLSTYLPALILALGVGIALPAIPTLARSFHVSFGVASLVITAFLVGGTVGTIPTGWMIDRFGRRKIMLAGPLLTATMAFLVFTAHSFPQLVIYRFFDGWAAQMWLMGRLTAIADKAQANQRGRQVGWMFSMDNSGRLSGPLVGGFIASAWGIRTPFFAYGVLALVALAVSFKFIKDTAPRPRAATPSAVPTQKPTIARIVLPRLAFFGLAFFAAAARGPIFGDMLHLYAAFVYHLSPQAIGILATTASSVGLPIGLLMGYLMDRYGRKRTMIPGFTGMTVGMVLIAVTALLHLSLLWYVAAFLFTVVTQSLTSGSVQTVGADVAPPEARGMFLGLWRFTGQVGTSVSPLAFAFLADAAGYPSAFIFVAIAALAAAVLLIVFVPETGRQRVFAS